MHMYSWIIDLSLWPVWYYWMHKGKWNMGRVQHFVYWRTVLGFMGENLQDFYHLHAFRLLQRCAIEVHLPAHWYAGLGRPAVPCAYCLLPKWLLQHTWVPCVCSERNNCMKVFFFFFLFFSFSLFLHENMTELDFFAFYWACFHYCLHDIYTCI